MISIFQLRLEQGQRREWKCVWKKRSHRNIHRHKLLDRFNEAYSCRWCLKKSAKRKIGWQHPNSYPRVMNVHWWRNGKAHFRKQFSRINLNFNLSSAGWLPLLWCMSIYVCVLCMYVCRWENFVCCFAYFRFVLEIKFLFTLILNVSALDFAIYCVSWSETWAKRKFIRFSVTYFFSVRFSRITCCYMNPWLKRNQ